MTVQIGRIASSFDTRTRSVTSPLRMAHGVAAIAVARGIADEDDLAVEVDAAGGESIEIFRRAGAGRDDRGGDIAACAVRVEGKGTVRMLAQRRAPHGLSAEASVSARRRRGSHFD